MDTLDMVKNLRDEFAMAGLTGVMANTGHAQAAGGNSASIAKACYSLADAMMEARKIKPEAK
jgi:hypothetical protein